MQIPLFPLPNLVLFPQVVLPLHIFEDRYKLMINRCIDSDDVFGLVLLRPGAEEESEHTIHRVGVTARIVQVERLEDGRMNILNAGETRFRIQEFTGKSPYWTANVELFEDDPESPAELQAAYEQVAVLYRRAAEISAELKSLDVQDLAVPESPVALSYMVSYVLDLDSSRKQYLLETTSTVERLTSLVDDLNQVIATLEKQIVRREIVGKVKGNGDLGKPHKG